MWQTNIVLKPHPFRAFSGESLGCFCCRFTTLPAPCWGFQSPWLSPTTSTEIFSQSAPFVLLKTKVSKNASNTGWISRCWAKRCGGREQSYKWLNGPREPPYLCVCLKMGDTCAKISHWVFQGNKWNMYDLRRRGDHFLKLFLQISLENNACS